MKRVLTILTVLLLTTALYSQEVTVYDKSTGDALPGVSVLSSKYSALTNREGKVNLSDYTGSKFITFRMLGYTELTYTPEQISKMNYEVHLKESVFSLNEIVVSASKWQERRQEVPAKIISIKPENIKLGNSQTSADIISDHGQIYVQKSQLGGGSPMIRGFSANKVLIVVDGVRMNNAIYRSGNLQNVISIDPNTIETTEIVLGPGSVMYGSDALGGVMDFHLLKPRLSTSDDVRFEGDAMTRFSSANQEGTWHASVNTGVGKWAIASAFSYSKFNDLKMGSHGPDEYLKKHYVIRKDGIDKVIENDDPEKQRFSGYSQRNFLQKIRFKPNNKWDLTYSFLYTETSDVPRYDRLVKEKAGKPVYAEWYYGPQKWMMNNISATFSGKKIIADHIKMIAAHQLYKESRYDRKLNSDKKRSQEEKVNVYTLNIDADKKINNKKTLYYGIEGVFNTINSVANKTSISTSKVSPTGSRYPDNSKYATAALYANYKYQIAKRMFLMAGARYSYINVNIPTPENSSDFPFLTNDVSINMGALNGSAGLAYNPNNSTQLNLNLSSGYRAPNIDDLAKVFNYDDDAIVVPNSNLSPEYAYNAEVGITKTFIDRIQLSVCGFYTHLNNAMVKDDFTYNGKSVITEDDGTQVAVKALVNKDYANIYGISASVKADINSFMALKSDITYTDGEDKDGYSLRHVSPLFGSTHLFINSRKIKTDIYLNYHGEVSYDNLAPVEREKPQIYATDSNGNPYSPSWYTANIKVNYFVTKNIIVNAALENIFDKRYRTYSSGIVAPGRNFIIGLRLKV